MPVFFFIDPDFASDPAMRNIDDIILHYTFFRAHYGDGTAVSDSKKEPEMNADEKAASLANAAILSPEVIDTRKDNSN